MVLLQHTRDKDEILKKLEINNTKWQNFNIIENDDNFIISYDYPSHEYKKLENGVYKEIDCLMHMEYSEPKTIMMEYYSKDEVNEKLNRVRYETNETWIRQYMNGEIEINQKGGWG